MTIRHRSIININVFIGIERIETGAYPYGEILVFHVEYLQEVVTAQMWQ